jgi:hypothetical protein
LVGRPHAAPNPFRPGSNGAYDASGITFSEIPAGSTIRIYTLVGELVAELTDVDGNGMESWNVKNNSGKDLASGVYVYVIVPASGPAVRGKVVIVR